VNASDAAALRRRWLLGIAAACILGVAAAIVAQYRFDMRPCPWCILQRFIYVVIAAVAFVGALTRPLQRPAGALVALLAAAGIGSAIYQNVVASRQFSCDLTAADRVITALRLESIAPALFQVTASCADAAVSMFHVPFEFWSLALYLLVGAAALRIALRRA
jgi:disulfide bond formation protein DsbB